MEPTIKFKKSKNGHLYLVVQIGEYEGFLFPTRAEIAYIKQLTGDVKTDE